MAQMQVSCINVEIDTSETLGIEKRFNREFSRMFHLIRDAQVSLRDVNGPKGGIDKLCTFQLLLYPRGVEVVKGNGSTFLEAMGYACSKMKHILKKRLSRRKSYKHGDVQTGSI